VTISTAFRTAALIAATLTLGACGAVPGSGDSDWRSEARCQPPGGGLDPEQVLPDPQACPEAYEGSGSRQAGGPGVPPAEPPSSAPPVEPPANPCDGPGLNGFECHPVDPRGNPGPYYPPAIP
jgi:hypothetical protein